MKLICGQDAAVAAWVLARIPHMAGGDFGPCVAIGVTDDAGLLVAGAVYHGYNALPGGGDIQMSMAADSAGWARKGIIRGLLHYPFEQAGCHRITTITPFRNARALKINAGLGFEVEGRVRRGFGDDDAIIMGLLREDASRWLVQDIFS
jgi:RimJ/RimL family protein N-acetyltransferase